MGRLPRTGKPISSEAQPYGMGRDRRSLAAKKAGRCGQAVDPPVEGPPNRTAAEWDTAADR